MEAVMAYVKDLVEGKVQLPPGIETLDPDLQQAINQALGYGRDWGHHCVSLVREVVVLMNEYGNAYLCELQQHEVNRQVHT